MPNSVAFSWEAWLTAKNLSQIAVPNLPRWLSGLRQCAPTGTVCRRGGVQSPGQPVDFVFGFQGRML